MFWGRLAELNTPENLEWLDWKGTPNTGRRLDWSTKPMKVMPQLCMNSKGLLSAVAKRAALIGGEIAEGVKKLHAVQKDDLFLGVIAGWETRIGRDFDTGNISRLSRALERRIQRRQSAGRHRRCPRRDCAGLRGLLGSITDRRRCSQGQGLFAYRLYVGDDVQDFPPSSIRPWVAAPYLQVIEFTPPAVAYCDSCIPGVSTYPQPGHLDQWQAEREKHGNPPWASCEGTAIDPGEAERSGNGMNMERYLGNLFNHGAVLVNVFGWGVGNKDNPFRKIAEGDTALAAYRKFLRGDKLEEAAIPIPALPPAGLREKVRKVQAMLPGWIKKNGPAKVKDDVEKLGRCLKENLFEQAAEAADAILKTIGD